MVYTAGMYTGWETGYTYPDTWEAWWEERYTHLGTQGDMMGGRYTHLGTQGGIWAQYTGRNMGPVHRKAYPGGIPGRHTRLQTLLRREAKPLSRKSRIVKTVKRH